MIIFIAFADMGRHKSHKLYYTHILIKFPYLFQKNRGFFKIFFGKNGKNMKIKKTSAGSSALALIYKCIKFNVRLTLSYKTAYFCMRWNANPPMSDFV